jgi:hypothetical protein
MKQQSKKKLFMQKLVGVVASFDMTWRSLGTEPRTMEDARNGIPVTMQRRFDVYADVNQGRI